MFKVLLQLDEERIQKDNQFNLSDIYKYIDTSFKESNCYLLEQDNNKYIYSTEQSNQALSNLFIPSFEIKTMPWFKYMDKFFLVHNEYSKDEWVYEDMTKDWEEQLEDEEDDEES